MTYSVFVEHRGRWSPLWSLRPSGGGMSKSFAPLDKVEIVDRVSAPFQNRQTVSRASDLLFLDHRWRCRWRLLFLGHFAEPGAECTGDLRHGRGGRGGSGRLGRLGCGRGWLRLWRGIRLSERGPLGLFVRHRGQVFPRAAVAPDLGLIRGFAVVASEAALAADPLAAGCLVDERFDGALLGRGVVLGARPPAPELGFGEI